MEDQVWTDICAQFRDCEIKAAFYTREVSVATKSMELGEFADSMNRRLRLLQVASLHRGDIEPVIRAFKENLLTAKHW